MVLKSILSSPLFHPVLVCAVMEWVIELGRGRVGGPEVLAVLSQVNEVTVRKLKEMLL